MGRNLPKILNFVKIIHYFLKLFTGVLTEETDSWSQPMYCRHWSCSRKPLSCSLRTSLGASGRQSELFCSTTASCLHLADDPAVLSSESQSVLFFDTYSGRVFFCSRSSLGTSDIYK